jgi:hypothetical protein
MIDEKRLETQPVQHIRNLLASVRDGKLTINYYDPIYPPRHRTYEVACTAEDADALVGEYEALVQALEAIGKARAKLDARANPEDVLSPEQVVVFNTYIRDFNEAFDAGEYDLNELYLRREDGDQLNDEEYEVLECHYEWFGAQCLKRLPQKAYPPMFLVNKVQRYEYLIGCNAPKAVLDEEGRLIAEEMILYYFAKNDTFVCE